MPERCELTELIKEQCAHCLGISEEEPVKPLSKAKRAEMLAVEAENLLLLMNTNKVIRRGRTIGRKLPLRHFDRAEPYFDGGAELIHADVMDDHIFTDAQPWDLSERLDITMANRNARGVLAWGEDMIARRYRLVKRPMLPLQRLTRYIVEVGYLAVDTKAGRAFPSVNYYGVNRPGEEWRSLTPCGAEETSLADYDACKRLIGLACGLQLARDYAWRVHLKYSDAQIGIMIPTTPSGVRALFRLRDHEPGASRRSALAHWVSGHSRRIKKDTSEEDLIWVRDHLRGKPSFAWQDMRGVIYPSGYDLRRLADLKRGGTS